MCTVRDGHIVFLWMIKVFEYKLMIHWKEWFYWTIVQSENRQIDGKWMIFLRSNEINSNKRKKMVRSQTMNEQNKKFEHMSISKGHCTDHFTLKTGF